MLKNIKSHYLGKMIILLLVLFCSMSYGQGWNTTVQTSINEPNLEKMDLFTNASGNHILIKRTNGNIVYYNISSAGTIDASKTATLETSGDFPNIVGSGNVVYALYKTGNYIKTKYSANGGVSWTYDSNLDRSIGSNLCNGVDAVYENQQGVHLVWATQDNGSNFETYYYRLTTGHSWVENKNVTDHASNQIGGFPSVAYSSNRVHVSNKADVFDNVFTRDRFNGVWQTPQNPVSGSEESAEEHLIARGETLYLFYARKLSSSPLPFDLVYRTRCVTCTTWSPSITRANTLAHIGNSIRVTKTANDDIHLISDGGVYNNQTYGFTHSYYNGSIWSTPESISNEDTHKDFSVNSVSNDLFVTWSRPDNGFLKYNQYDQNPLTPTNLTVTKSGTSNPYLSWTANLEPDLDYYEIWKKGGNEGGDWHLKDTTSNTFYEDESETVVTGAPQMNEGIVYYRIKAVDNNNYKSGFSSEVSIRVYFDPLDKSAFGNTSNGLPVEFLVLQNYPNPFNPSTKITYALPEDAKVQIKVYDILGTEVAELVNESKPAGFYEAAFDAFSLSSGIYIYRITALNGERILFTESKQMVLMK